MPEEVRKGFAAHARLLRFMMELDTGWTGVQFLVLANGRRYPARIYQSLEHVVDIGEKHPVDFRS